jgi:outer membrane protein OmpA-like peptidoglycan-associated protein
MISNAFCRELSENYSRYAKDRAAKYDWKDARHFTRKSLNAALCGQVELETFRGCAGCASRACYPISFLTTEIREIRKIVKDSLLTKHVKGVYPKLAADVQLFYDCWISQKAKRYAAKATSVCRTEFYKSAAELARKTKQDLPSITARTPGAFCGLTVIFFENASKTLSEAAQKTAHNLLDKIDLLTQNKYYKIVLIGHADEEMEADCNQEISEGRVSEVKKYLISKGTCAERIITTAMGNGIPLTWHRERRHENRRVEMFLVIEQEEDKN